MSEATPANLDKYANQFDEIEVEERTPIIDLLAINPLSELREEWQNTTTMPTEHKISTSANTNDTGYLETEERGQYTSGFQVQSGTGIRLPTAPTGDSIVRWGYYDVDGSGNPQNGFYFGVDSTGIFVARANAGSVEKVYQDSWNRDRLNGDDGSSGPNPSGLTLDLADGQVFQIEFVYYGYGSIEMQVLVDQTASDQDSNSEIVTVHTFQPDGTTSTENTNLPLRQEIESTGTTNDALDLYVGGRQVSIVGKDTTNSRTRRAVNEGPLSIDDTKWYAAVSIKIKDGSGGADGTIDFRNVLAELVDFSCDVGAVNARWAFRRDTTPDNPSWNQSPVDIGDDEIACKYDINSADVQDSNGNLTGHFIAGSRLQSGTVANPEARTDTADFRITAGAVITLLFKAPPGESGDIDDIVFRWGEQW